MKVITSDDEIEIWQLKEHISQQFHIKDLGPLKYFLGIEVTQSYFGIVINQHKYIVNILTKTSMLDYHPCDTSIDLNIKLLLGLGETDKPSEYNFLVVSVIS